MKKPRLVNRSAVRRLAKSLGKNVARDLHEHVENKVSALIGEAVARADGNGRATVRGIDL